MVSAAATRIGCRRALIDGHALSINRIAVIEPERLRLQLTEYSTVHGRVSAVEKLVDQALEKGPPVYGVKTGFGGMFDFAVPSRLAAASHQNLLSFLTSGAGLTIHQSGNFLGHFVDVAMNGLRRKLVPMAMHADVQIVSFVAPALSYGLPFSLQGNDKLALNVGLKELQVTVNSIMAMRKFQGNPLVEHYSTHAEQFRQNINRLAWGAAIFARKSVELFQNYIVVALLFAVQAIDLRANATRDNCDGKALLSSLLAPFFSAVCEAIGSEFGRERPSLIDDFDQWLEQQPATLRDDIASRESIVNAKEPLSLSFDTSMLCC